MVLQMILSYNIRGRQKRALQTLQEEYLHLPLSLPLSPSLLSSPVKGCKTILSIRYYKKMDGSTRAGK